MSNNQDNGDAAAIREALTKVSEWMAHRIATGGFEASPTIPTVLEDVVLPALAKPPRNCDKLSAEEQVVRFLKVCRDRKHFDDVRKCPLFVGPNCYSVGCFARWAQMPYEKGENNGSK